GRREPAPGRAHSQGPGCGTKGLRPRFRIFPGAARAPQTLREHALGRRAADAGGWKGAAHEAPPHAARRAIAGPRADSRALHLPDHPHHQRGRPRRGPAGRAERTPRARDLVPGVRAGGRPERRAWRQCRAQRQRFSPPFLPRVLADVQEFVQQVVSGIASGGIFASLALALVLIYNAMGLVNFAQGEMAMFATFIAYTLISHGVNYFIAFPLTLGLAFIGGVLIERAVIRPVERAPVLTLVIVTLGLATLINCAAGFLFGYTPNYFSSPFSAHTVNIFGAFASYQDLSVIAVSGIVLVAIYLLLQRTTLGLTLRAAAHHPEASRLLGVRVSWMLALGWGLASAVGAVSGIMV